ncbi:hypothetical protein MANES_09G008350v8 [Manihot esculenta]|uniref:Uncharacterized protein n=1 Tax=Manihot esculenta TaxID=3983 RepID=A0ACB7H416_MANES|nr:hypothetical protein MANES_09G008350v8 [Manihot esculenta]
MWEEGEEYGLLKIFIEFVEKNNNACNRDSEYDDEPIFVEKYYSCKSIKGISNASATIQVPSVNMQIEMPLMDAPIMDESSDEDDDFIPNMYSDQKNSIDESLVEEIDSKDDE